MDAKRFEAMSRAVGQAASRRGVMAALVGGALGGVVLAPEAEAGIPIVNCKIPGQKCSRNQKCCTGRCSGKGRCRCSRKGRPCWSPLEGALCCSGRCASGKCA